MVEQTTAPTAGTDPTAIRIFISFPSTPTPFGIFLEIGLLDRWTTLRGLFPGDPNP